MKLYRLEYEANNGKSFINSMKASEVAYILETTIIPKKYPFKLREYVSGYDDLPAFMMGDDKAITINRDFGVDPKILKALS